jgi:putative ubiquitin-RnfH superfamily antitoxin RatB of RatAB toxin-antitoxin module
MRITLLRAWPDRHESVELDIPEGATVAEALARANWTLAAEEPVGIWGKVQPPDKRLRDGDRVEVYRPLVADPKTARRKRAVSAKR